MGIYKILSKYRFDWLIFDIYIYIYVMDDVSLSSNEHTLHHFKISTLRCSKYRPGKEQLWATGRVKSWELALAGKICADRPFLFFGWSRQTSYATHLSYYLWIKKGLDRRFYYNCDRVGSYCLFKCKWISWILPSFVFYSAMF